MRVTINGYGLAEFKPTELYRFLGREDMTQLRGKVRIQRSDLDVRTTGGEDWIDYDFWFTLDQVIIDRADDLNLMVGLKVKTVDELRHEESRKDKDSNESLDITYETFTVTNDKTLLIVKAKNKPNNVSWEDLCATLQDFEVANLAAPAKWVAGEGVKLKEQANGTVTVSLVDEDETLFEDYNAENNTDIEEEIQRVLEELKTSDIYGNHYAHLLTILDRLIDIREKI